MNSKVWVLWRDHNLGPLDHEFVAIYSTWEKGLAAIDDHIALDAAAGRYEGVDFVGYRLSPQDVDPEPMRVSE